MNSAASMPDRILDEAQVLIVAGGYNGFSYADISAAIGIRKASIHHHFATKAELVTALLDRYRRQVEAGLEAARTHAPQAPAQLQAYLGFWQGCIRNATQPFCVCALLASEMQMLPEPVAARVRGHFDYLAKWLTALLADGAFRLDRPASEEAQLLMASVHGAMLSARAFGDPELFAAITDAHLAKLTATTD